MCIVKNFIWTTLQENPQIPDVQIVVLNQILPDPNKPYINGKRIYSSFMWWIHKPNALKYVSNDFFLLTI